jgi:guanylate kinase
VLLVISGPSGAGKGSLCAALLRDCPEVGFSVSAATRQPREGEVDGVHYHFLSEQEFQRQVTTGGFLEWAEVYGRRYGTLREPVERMLAAGQDVALDLDTQGAAMLKKIRREGVFVFILPPSFQELKRRIVGRGTETPEEIERRLREGMGELKLLPLYDYVLVNVSLERTLERLKAILSAERCRVSRQEYLPKAL